MKRFVFTLAFSSLLSVGAFVVLLGADRQLGVPLPHSIPLAFGSVSLLAPVMFAIANQVRLRRPIVVASPRVQPAKVRTSSPARVAHAVVLLDFSPASACQEQAA